MGNLSQPTKISVLSNLYNFYHHRRKENFYMPSKEKKTVQKASGESKPSVKTVTVSQEQREEVESQLQADGYQIMSAKTAGDKVTITAKCFDPPKRAHREFED